MNRKATPSPTPLTETGPPGRMRGLPETEILGVMVPVATGSISRFRGLARMDPEPDGCGLLIPGCRSVHTFGMRFALDIHFLDAEGRIVRSEMRVSPGRLLHCRRARAVLELQSAP